MGDEAAKLVLVVEDIAEQANAMLQSLQAAGIHPMSVPNVREAIFKLKNQKFSCIVMDLLLGEENGKELIELIRTKKDLSNLDTPILVVSANLSKETLQGLAGKVQGAVVKPLDMGAFVAQVQRLAK